MNRRVLGAVVVITVVALLLMAGEAVLRVIDGFSLAQFILRDVSPAATQARLSRLPRDNADATYLDRIPLAKGVDRSWYTKDPPPHGPIPMTPAIAARAAKYAATDPLGAFFAWNPNYLKLEMCQGLRFGSLGVLDDFFVFEPSSKSEYPIYRHLSDIQPTGWFPTNRFGWRGPDLELNKPPRTIRIAFGGSSMTIDQYTDPFSHIEYIGEWFNLWAKATGDRFRVEIINTARTGVDSSSVAAAVIEELLPLEPDLVIFDGANDFKPGLLLKFPKEGVPTVPPGFGAPATWEAEHYSAIVRRLRILATTMRPLAEARKPVFPIAWPADVNEMDPDIAHKPLPMAMDLVLANFDAMSAALAGRGGQLALTTEASMVEDGLLLEWPRHATLFNSLNYLAYPITYAQSRRLMDFQNRLYTKYAAARQLPLIDKAALIPRDPNLFLDVVHMTTAGARLQSWILFQWLVSWVDTEVGAGRLPRSMQHPASAHPAFPAGEYPLLSRDAIMASCKASH